jgi:hypothetical protein
MSLLTSDMVSLKMMQMFYLFLFKLFFSVEPQYNYDKLLHLIAEKESKFQCQVVDPLNITYGRYQVTPHLIQQMGFQMPMDCEKQDQMMRKLLGYYEQLLNVEKYEFKYYRGVLLHRTNLLVAMHFAPYGTIRYLETGVDFSNGLVSVSYFLKRYEEDNFYELR